jgi:hypothetical protein
VIGDSVPVRTVYSVPAAIIIAALAVIVIFVLDHPPDLEFGWVGVFWGALVFFVVISLVILPGALCSGPEWKTHKVRRVTGLTFVTIGAIVACSIWTARPGHS